jgi:hypothetical protein
MKFAERFFFRAPVAQMDRALASEAKGREFDPHRARHVTCGFPTAFLRSFSAVIHFQSWSMTAGPRPFAVGLFAGCQSVLMYNPGTRFLDRWTYESSGKS